MKEKKFKLLVLPSVHNMQQVVNKFSFPVELTKGQLKNLEVVFQNGKLSIFHKGVDLKTFSFVWLCSSWRTRDLAYAIKLYLDQNSVPSTHVEKGTSKLTDQIALSICGLSTPDTLFIGHKKVEECFAQIKKVCGFPLIVKDVKGARGVHSAKISTEKELVEKMKEFPKYKKYMFQRCIVNEYDWGIMVANGVVVAGEKRYHCEGEFRNNVCKGGTEVFVDEVEIPEELKQLALDASQKLGLHWSRTDIIIDKKTNKPYILEVNRLPGLTPKTREIEGAFAFLSGQIKSLVRV